MRNGLFSFVVAAILVFGVALNSPSVVDNRSIAEQVLESSVEIHACENGTIAVGSGVVYKVDGEVFILTAAHVIGEGKGLYIVTQSDPDDDLVMESWTANVVAHDPVSDWAILRPVGDSRCIKGGTTFVP